MKSNRPNKPACPILLGMVSTTNVVINIGGGKVTNASKGSPAKYRKGWDEVFKPSLN